MWAMSASSLIAFTLAGFILTVVAAGFASGSMPNNLKGLEARRDSAPFAFWLFTGAYLFGVVLLIVVGVRGWGK